MKTKKYKVTYRLYKNSYEGTPEEITVVTEKPWEYLEKVKEEIKATRPHMHVGTSIVEPINHLEVIK